MHSTWRSYRTDLHSSGDSVARHVFACESIVGVVRCFYLVSTVFLLSAQDFVLGLVWKCHLQTPVVFQA